MKMTENTKKRLAIGGGAVICAGLIVAIGLQFGKAPAGEDKLPEESSSAVQIVVDPSVPASGSTEEKKVVIQPNTDASSSTDTSQPVDTRPAQTDQTEQSIQPEVTKPAEPEESAKTDPTQKPDGTKVDTPPTPVDHDTYTPPTEQIPSTNQPQGGDVKDGKTYLPGFGYIENSGPNQENHAEDMYENGNKIGSMD